MKKIKNMLLGVYRFIRNGFKFTISAEKYWETRYEKGGTSGAGSYGLMANYKAGVINNFVKENNINSVIEFGSGDGNQLSLAEYPKYLGFDVSQKAVEICKSRFAEEKNKEFRILDNYNNETADLTLSLEVIFHLLNEESFVNHMHLLFTASDRFVIIFSSDTDNNKMFIGSHEKHWKFTEWISNNLSNWDLYQYIKNVYPYDEKTGTGSLSDFYIYKKKNLKKK